MTITDAAIQRRHQRSGNRREKRRPAGRLQWRRRQLLGRHVRVRPGLRLHRQRRSAGPGDAAGAGHPGTDDGRSLERQDDDRRVRSGRSEQHRQLAADPGHEVLLLDRAAGRRDRPGEQHRRRGLGRQHVGHARGGRPTTATSATRMSRSQLIRRSSRYTAPGAVVNYGGQIAARPTRVRASTTTATPVARCTTRAPTERSRRRRSARSQSAPRRPPPARAQSSRSTDVSAYKASGTVELTVGGKLAGTAKFSLQPKAKGSLQGGTDGQGQGGAPW